MEAAGNLIYCISQTMGIIPMIGSVPGFLGFIQSSFSTIINVIHCTFWGGTCIGDYIMPVFGELGIGGGK